MNIVFLIFIGLAWVGIDCAIGGTRLIYSLPFYAIISIAAVLSVVSFRRRRLPPNFLCLATTLLLGAWILLRAWNSPVAYLAWPDFSMMIGCLMVYLITAFYLDEIKSQTALIILLWAIAAAEFLVAMVQFLHDPNFMLFGFGRPTIQRASGMYISPNNFGGLLSAVAIISVSMGIWSRWPVWAKIVSLYVAGFCFAGVAISGSRGSYFDSIGGLLCIAIGSSWVIRIVNPPRFLLLSLLSLAGLVAGVGLIAFLMGHSAFLTHRMQTMVVKDVRIYNWQAALDHIKVSPWIGTGSGTHLIYGRLFRRPEIQADPVHAHCDYLELLAEYGIVGALCIALFLFAHIRNACRTLRDIIHLVFLRSGFNYSNRFAIQFGALCAVAGLGIHSIFDFDMHIPGNALVFAFLFGVLSNSGLERPFSFADRNLTPWARLVAPVLGVFMLCWGAPLIPSEYFAEQARRALRAQDSFQVISYAQQGLHGYQMPAPPSAPGTSGGDAGDQADAQPAEKPSGPLTHFFQWMVSKAPGDPKNPDLYFYTGEANRIIAARLRNPYLTKPYYDQAVASFESGLRIFPQHESMLVRYAQVLDEMRRYEDAETIYQRAIHWDPNLEVIRSYYVDHLRAEGKSAEAEALAADLREHKVKAVDSDTKMDALLQ